MSPRIKRIRKVLSPPVIKGFKPYGVDSNKQNTESVILLYEEYESLRLCDYDMYNHHQASELMNVSRPTFTRIYASARQKIAKAFVEGKQISIEGGKVYFDSDWYLCKTCKCYFNNPEKENKITFCPLCGGTNIIEFDYDNINEDYSFGEYLNDDYCICLNCGYEEKHQLGKPCSQNICLKCNSLMKRKRKFNK